MTRMAGESAHEFARRQREKSARLARSAELWERGAEGEVATANELNKLDRNVWTVFHDVRWPGRKRANIDHIAVGPGGVFVIDSKHWTGALAVSGDELRVNGRSREKAVAGAADAALAVTSVLGQLPAVPVLCFVRDEPITGWTRDVMVCSTANLVDMLVTRPPTLHQATISRLLPVLQRSLVSASQPPPHGRRAPVRVVRTPKGSRPSGSQRKRRSREPSALGLLGLIVGALVFIFAGRPLLSSFSDEVGEQIVNADRPAAFGSAQTVAANSGHPELRITAGRPAVTTAGGGRLPAAGHRLVAVPVSVENKGDRSWAWDDQTRLVITDQVYTSYAPSSAYRQVRAGRPLRGSPTVMPGTTLDRIAVFEVPVGRKVARVLFVVGPGRSTTLRWTASGKD